MNLGDGSLMRMYARVNEQAACITHNSLNRNGLINTWLQINRMSSKYFILLRILRLFYLKCFTQCDRPLVPPFLLADTMKRSLNCLLGAEVGGGEDAAHVGAEKSRDATRNWGGNNVGVGGVVCI